jgi:hypothetical protein
MIPARAKSEGDRARIPRSPDFAQYGEIEMNKLQITGVLLASALAAAGCGQAENKAAPAANTAASAPAAPAAPAPGGAPDGAAQGQAQQNFTVVNNSGHTVMTLNVSPSNEDSWGPDILGADTVANGQTAEVTFERGQSQCLWDIRVTYDDGDSNDMRGVNLCEVATVTLNP